VEGALQEPTKTECHLCDFHLCDFGGHFPSPALLASSADCVLAGAFSKGHTCPWRSGTLDIAPSEPPGFIFLGKIAFYSK
jgi:hypothetical protein